jgi:hypothetical protein
LSSTLSARTAPRLSASTLVSAVRAPPLAEPRAHADQRRHRGEDRTLVTEDLLRQHPRGRRRKGCLHDPFEVRPHALGDKPRARTLDRLLEQRTSAQARPRRLIATSPDSHI